MTSGEALKAVRDAAAGRLALRFTQHATERLNERRILKRDVLNVLATTFSVVAQLDGTWKTTGTTLGGKNLTLVVAFEGGVLVVTAWTGGRR